MMRGGRAQALFLLLPLLCALMALSPASVPGASAAPPAPTFVTGVLPAAPDVGFALNRDIEPGIAVAPDGTFWVDADITGADPRAYVSGLPKAVSLLLTTSGSDVWKSTDGGKSYQWVAAPFNLLPSEPGLGGDDNDIAVAPVRNQSGAFNVYAASLWGQCLPVVPCTADNISLAISQDGGHSWVVDFVAADLPLDDRPWLAAEGACTVYLTYHLFPVSATVVNRYDLCSVPQTLSGLTLVPLSSTRFVSLAAPALLDRPAIYTLAGFGKPVIDTSPASSYEGRLYIPVMDCGELTLAQEIGRAVAQDAACPAGVKAQVYVEMSADGGLHWTLEPVAESPNRAVSVWPTTIAVDRAGRVYVAWSDNHHSYLNVSTDGGNTWSRSIPLNGPAGTAVMPTVAALANGDVQVAYYGTTATGDANDASVLGLPGQPGAAIWRLYVDRSTDAGASFDLVFLSGPVHTGEICTNGDACTVPHTRDLYDDFGAAISPVTDRISVAYTADQGPGGLVNPFTAFATQLP